jgi:MFS superfamily sulfate permease-like transporter
MAFALADERWLPKSVLCLRDYNLNKFLHDLLAGITVGLVALPLAMAFAIASGLTPQAGIYCAIVTGFLISAFGDPKRKLAVQPVPLSWLLRVSSPHMEWMACSCAPSWLESCSW